MSKGKETIKNNNNHSYGGQAIKEYVSDGGSWCPRKMPESDVWWHPHDGGSSRSTGWWEHLSTSVNQTHYSAMGMHDEVIHP